MNKFRRIRFWISLIVALIFWYMMGMIRHWYIIVILAIILDKISYSGLEKTRYIPSEDDEEECPDFLNEHMWFWIFLSWLAVAGVIFCFVDTNWKLMIVWLFVAIFAIYKLTKFVDKNQE